LLIVATEIVRQM